MSSSKPITRLCELKPGGMADCFALLAEKNKSATRDGNPYYRVLFRDVRRAATAMVWSDSAWFGDCDTNWQVGAFYKLRCRYSETQYGPQIDIDQIREVEEHDAAEGFDAADFCPSTRFDVQDMYAELMRIAADEISETPLSQLVVAVLSDHETDVKRMPAASRNHHAFIGGYLEHVLSVTKTALSLAEKYAASYPELQPPLSKSLVVAGAILHDVGKFQELAFQPQGAEYTAKGRLVGHILLGRDLIREYAVRIPELSPETQLRLEHIIIAHQNLPEWGSPVAPHTPEALLVHYADDIDAKFQMMVVALEEETEEDREFTPRHNPLRRAIFRGLRS